MEIRTDIFRIKIALFSQAAIKIYSRFSTQETDEIHVRLRQAILISRQESMNMRLSVNKTFSRCVLCKMHLNISIGLVAYEGSWHFTLLVFFLSSKIFWWSSSPFLWVISSRCSKWCHIWKGNEVMNDLCVRTRFKGSSFSSLMYLYKICGWAFKIKMTMEKELMRYFPKVE